MIDCKQWIVSVMMLVSVAGYLNALLWETHI